MESDLALTIDAGIMSRARIANGMTFFISIVSPPLGIAYFLGGE